MQHEKLISTLKILIPKLEGIKWCLIGSGNLYLQGFNVFPVDIDILCFEGGAAQAGRILKEDETTRIDLRRSDDFESIFGEFYVNDVRVQVMEEIKFRSGRGFELLPSNLGRIIIANRNGLEVPCLSLDDELKAYETMNRDKDEDKIGMLRERMGY